MKDQPAAPQPVVQAAPKPAPAPVVQTGVNHVIRDYNSACCGEIKIEKLMPEKVQLNQPFDYTIQVTNLTDMMLSDIVVKADKVGTYKNQAMAMGDGDLKAQSGETQTVVTQPVLAIEKTGPKNEYLGRSVSYEIVVANKGDAVAAETVVTDTLPGNVGEVKVSDNGQVTTGLVTWNLGAMAPGASRKLSVSYTPAGAGLFKNEAKATAVCTAAVAASAATQVAGIPAVLLEVVDVDDPIEVGNNETYIITVTNQGSAADTNIKIKVFLEDSMQFVSAGGATRGAFADGAVTFEPLPSLAAKAATSWRVVVKAVKAGDVRLKVTMDTEELDREVTHADGTYVCMEGPQFSTRAESLMHRTWGGDLIGMTAMPEAKLAREAQMCYALVALVSDYDCWRDHDIAADKKSLLEEILSNLNQATQNAVMLIEKTLEIAPALCDETCPCRKSLELAVWTNPQAVDSDLRLRLAPLFT